jgi:hypothetical protein
MADNLASDNAPKVDWKKPNAVVTDGKGTYYRFPTSLLTQTVEEIAHMPEPSLDEPPMIAPGIGPFLKHPERVRLLKLWQYDQCEHDQEDQHWRSLFELIRAAPAPKRRNAEAEWRDNHFDALYDFGEVFLWEETRDAGVHHTEWLCKYFRPLTVSFARPLKVNNYAVVLNLCNLGK